MNRSNTIITKFKSRDEFENSIDSIAKLQLKRSKLIAERDIKSQKVLENYNPEITAIEEEISTLQADVTPYAVANAERLFGKKRSASCSLAIYGFKKGNKKVENKSGYTDAILAERLFNADYTNCAEASFKLNKKGIQKALKEGDEEIKKLFEETQDERFYVEANPAIAIVYEVKEKLCKLLNKKRQNAKQCKENIRVFQELIKQMKESQLEDFLTLAKTLESWAEEIVRMWIFTKNNGILEGFHCKMKLIQRRAYGYRNFENYRLRVLIQCNLVKDTAPSKPPKPKIKTKKMKSKPPPQNHLKAA